MKCLLVAVAVLLVVPMPASAGSAPTKDALSVGRVVSAAAGDNPTARRITVPIALENQQVLVAMDIPLSFGHPGDGISLVDVKYASRVAYFDEKITNIDNDKKTVDMGLISMAYDPTKADLASGTGEIAYLTFEVTDPTINEISITPTTMNQPSHRLMLVYHEYVNGRPEVRWKGENDGVFTPVVVPVEASVAMAGLPTSFALEQNYPNPFNAGTIIKFALPEAGHAKVTVFNVLGQTVRVLADRDFAAGYQMVPWDGTDENGSSAASGVYFYRIQANGFSDTKKMTLLK